MKSYLLVTGDFVKTGGMDRANFALAEYLAKQGEQVYLVAHRVATELLAYDNVNFYQVPKVINSYFLSSPLFSWIGRTKAEQLSKDGTRVVVNGGNCQWGDINWVHYVHAAYPPSKPKGLLRQLKGTLAHKLYLDTELKAFQSAKVIIVNSERTKQDLIQKLAISEQKIHKVYYGIDPRIFYPATSEEKILLRQQLEWSPDRPVIMFIGALGDRRKGFDTVFQAWQQLNTLPNWNADLVVIGAGGELAQWQNRTIKAGISNLHFLGFRSDVPNLLRAADCLVAPTRYEAYGLAVHEALCCGLPAIVSATAGVAERYPANLQDLLIPDFDNVADLANRLQKWWQSQEYYHNLVYSLAEKLREYTWDDMAKNIINKIEDFK